MAIGSALMLGLSLFVATYVAAIAFTWNDIEQDVAQRTRAELNEKGLNWVQIDTENRGRAVLLSGVAPSSQARENAIATAEDVWGVQSVDSDIQYTLGDPKTEYPARLQIHKQGRSIQLTGALSDDVNKDLLVGFIRHRLNGEVDTTQLQLASNIDQATWLSSLKYFLYDVDNSQDIRITVDGQRLALDGAMSADEIENLMDEARYHFDQGWSIENRMTLAQANQNQQDNKAALTPDLCQVHMNTLLHQQTINFAVGSAALQSDSAGLIQNIANIAKVCPQNDIRIEGHTDNTGDAAQNLTLSQQRAEAVLAALVASDVAKERLQAQGYGMQRPVESNSTDAGKAKNRRIEFRILTTSH